MSRANESTTQSYDERLSDPEWIATWTREACGGILSAQDQREFFYMALHYDEARSVLEELLEAVEFAHDASGLDAITRARAFLGLDAPGGDTA